MRSIAIFHFRRNAVLFAVGGDAETLASAAAQIPPSRTHILRRPTTTRIAFAAAVVMLMCLPNNRSKYFFCNETLALSVILRKTRENLVTRGIRTSSIPHRVINTWYSGKEDTKIIKVAIFVFFNNL